ncbi:unnamed protein product [Protopolystoma xenopodis]|uniref:Uncharacterized protein n=1 Tax=Protopolystoma xenopodis TaxID=117903 RepID=A0A448WLK2_9PLAT|nr:unnamed protein product [Protopolystoma xenopodis]
MPAQANPHTAHATWARQDFPLRRHFVRPKMALVSDRRLVASSSVDTVEDVDAVDVVGISNSSVANVQGVNGAVETDAAV